MLKRRFITQNSLILFVYKQVMAVRRDLKLEKGKLAGQVAHASVGAYRNAVREKPEWVKGWEREGEKKVVVWVKDEKELLDLYNAVKRKLPSILIKDAGLTQLEPGTITCAGFGPAPESEIDPFTGMLTLVG